MRDMRKIENVQRFVGLAAGALEENVERSQRDIEWARAAVQTGNAANALIRTKMMQKKDSKKRAAK
jgi:hypothetical protein